MIAVLGFGLPEASVLSVIQPCVLGCDLALGLRRELLVEFSHQFRNKGSAILYRKTIGIGGKQKLALVSVVTVDLTNLEDGGRKGINCAHKGSIATQLAIVNASTLTSR